MLDTKFLGIIMDSTLQWKAHTDSPVRKINAAFYAPRILKPIMSHTTWISYGLFFLFPLDHVLWHNFWGASPQSINTFKSHTHTHTQNNNSKYQKKGVI